MGRRPVFTDVGIVDAARTLAASEGPASVTMRDVAERLGAPIGSLYHRFPSRGALLARAWLESVELFQDEFLRKLANRQAGIGEIAGHTVSFCQTHPEHARLLLVHRQEDFLKPGVPAELAARARRLRAQLRRGLQRFARERLGSASPAALRRLVFAVVDIPYAAVRPHLQRGESVPPFLGGLVARAVHAVLPRMERWRP